MTGSFANEVLSGERAVYSFAVIWTIVLVLWIGLDWLSNPNRGRFHPSGDRDPATRHERREVRRRRQAEDDAAVRAALRDAYGASSLRGGWSSEREAEAVTADEALVTPRQQQPVPEPQPVPDLGVFTEQGVEPLLGTFDPGQPFEIDELMPRGRWKRGDNPLMLSPSGKPPAATTVRSRVWKNHCDDPMWGSANSDRMRSGKPPQRYNPLKDKIETGVVDLSSARPGWRGGLVDPYAADERANSR